MKVSGSEKNSPLMLWPILDFSFAIRYLFDRAFCAFDTNIEHSKHQAIKVCYSSILYFAGFA